MLEVFREENNPDSIHETKRKEKTRSEGLMLRKVGKGERFNWLMYLQEVVETKKGWLFEGCEIRVVEIV